MAGDSVSEIVEFICKDFKNVNKIRDILVDLENGNEEEVVRSSEILFEVFSFHLKNGTWKNTKLADNNLKTVKEANDAVKEWLSSSYDAFLKLLSTKMHDLSSNVQERCLVFFTEALAIESVFKIGKSNNKSIDPFKQQFFPLTNFDMLVNEMVLTSNFSTEFQGCLSSLLTYVDINFYFLKSLLSVSSNIIEKRILTVEELERIFKLLLMASKYATNVDENTSMYFIQRFTSAEKPFSSKNNNKLYRVAFTDAWLFLLRQENVSPTTRKKILVELDTKVIPYLQDPTLLIDFLADSFDEGGVTSILSLNGLFVLMSQHNLDYPDFYNKLYAVVDTSIFNMKYKSRFFHLVDLFLSSTHLPAYLVAAFVKRFSRMLLFTPVCDLVVVLTLIKNMVIRHPSCRLLIHRKKDDKSVENEKGDPFDYEEIDPAKCDASRSSLWEVETLASHYSSEVKKCVASFRKPLPDIETDIRQYFDEEYNDLFTTKLEKFSEEKPPVFEFAKKHFVLDELDEEMWSLE